VLFRSLYGGTGDDFMSGGDGAGDLCDGGAGIDALSGGNLNSGCEMTVNTP